MRGVSGKASEKCVCLVSGGLDSVALLYYAMKEFGLENVVGLYVDYGHRSREVERGVAEQLCKEIGVSFVSRKLNLYEGMVGTVSSLLNKELSSHNVEHERFKGLPVSFVPFRNVALLLSAAVVGYELFDFPVVLGIGSVVTDVSPDGKKDFFMSMEKTLNLALGSEEGVKVFAPLVDMRKSDYLKVIKSEDEKFFRFFEYSHSCYEEVVCGKCKACLSRQQAFDELEK